MATSCLLSLPPELRLRIYEFVVPSYPLSSPASQYAGLLYSCREIRYELESEILKRMTAALLEIQGRCRQVYDGDLEFTPPQSMWELYNLRVFRPDGRKMFARSDPFMALMYMHFDTLTITTSRSLAMTVPPPLLKGSPVYRLPLPSQPPPMGPSGSTLPLFQRNYSMRSLARWIATQIPYGDRPAAKRIVFDWSADPQVESKTCTWDSAQVLDRKKGWTLELWGTPSTIVEAKFVKSMGPLTELDHENARYRQVI